MRQVRAIEIYGDPVPVCDRAWPIMAGNVQVGRVTSAAYSPDFGTNVAIGMVRMTHWDEGTDLDVVLPNEVRSASVWETFWL